MNAALKARFNLDGWFSIPDVTLVEIDAVLAQQLAVFLLKRASAMVLLLRLDVLQHGLELAGAHRKRGIAALPEKETIARVKLFDPFRGRFLYLFDQLSLGKSSRRCRHNVNVIGTTRRARVPRQDPGRLLPDKHACAAARLNRGKARDSSC
jgi:hypothetical protein